MTGVTFDGVHSYEEWGLKLKSVSIGLPEEKQVFVDVPGMNGQLDLTEAQNGGSVYGMRTLEFVFDAKDCNYMNWTWLASKVARSIHGGKKKIVLDVDPEYFYVGRCSIDTKKTDEVFAEITVTCKCDPFKMTSTSENGDWLWDPFSFVDGVIRDTAGITINSTSSWQKVTVYGWVYNEALEIRTTAAMKLKFNNQEYDLMAGTNIMIQFDIQEGENDIYFKGRGTVTIIQRGGMI